MGVCRGRGCQENDWICSGCGTDSYGPVGKNDLNKVWTGPVLAGRDSHTVRKALLLAGYRLRWLLRSGISSDTPPGTRRLSSRQKARKRKASYLPAAVSMLVSTCVHHMGILDIAHIVCECVCMHKSACMCKFRRPIDLQELPLLEDPKLEA